MQCNSRPLSDMRHNPDLFPTSSRASCIPMPGQLHTQCQHYPFNKTLMSTVCLVQTLLKWTTFYNTQHINITLVLLPGSLQPRLIFILLPLSAVPPISPMITCFKNKLSSHPGTPDVSHSQLAAASGLACIAGARFPATKKLTKDQQIVALKEELRVTQELLATAVTSSVQLFSYGTDCHALLDAR